MYHRNNIVKNSIKTFFKKKKKELQPEEKYTQAASGTLIWISGFQSFHDCEWGLTIWRGQIFQQLPGQVRFRTTELSMIFQAVWRQGEGTSCEGGAS